MIPRELAGDDRALVIVDWSFWMRTAWAIGGIDSTASLVCGWLARLLSDPMPPSLVVAIDPDSRWTFRHAATTHKPEAERYKANRQPPSPDYIEIERRCRAVVEAHRIPILEPSDPTREQDWEADDSIAAAVRLATSDGRSVAIVSKDKDLLPLVDDDPTRPIVVRWDGNERVDTPASVNQTFGVLPEQMTDLLAMAGDPIDGVPGVKGMGLTMAKYVLFEHYSMDEALKYDPEAAPPSWPWPQKVSYKRYTRAMLMLHEQRDRALFSRTLVKLFDEAPITWDPQDQPVGDFDVRTLQKLYRGFGFTQLAESVPSFPKARW